MNYPISYGTYANYGASIPASELRKIKASEDDFGLITYDPKAMGFPVDMFPVLFAIPRTAGWLAQWQEMLLDKEQRIARPRQVYVGSDQRKYDPLKERGKESLVAHN